MSAGAFSASVSLSFGFATAAGAPSVTPSTSAAATVDVRMKSSVGLLPPLMLRPARKLSYGSGVALPARPGDLKPSVRNQLSAKAYLIAD